jgi:hypothetical protein
MEIIIIKRFKLCINKCIVWNIAITNKFQHKKFNIIVIAIKYIQPNHLIIFSLYFKMWKYQ